LDRSTTFWLTVITSIVIADAAHVRAQGLPVGWRLPTLDEVSDKERNDRPSRYAKATADFNRDGVADDAVLLKSNRYSAEALWVRLSADNSFTWVKLDETKWGKKYPAVNLSMGVDVGSKAPLQCICGATSTAGFCEYGLAIDSDGRASR
jgi:hypothetical protein